MNNMTQMMSLVRKWSQRNPELTSRLHRAVALTGNVTSKGPNTFQVEGSHGNIYFVYKGKSGYVACTCPDHKAGNHCKHRLAVSLVTKN